MSPSRSISVIVLTLAVGLVLAVIPLPEWALPYRPQWPLLILAYWCMAVPQRVGVISGWTVGLVTDTMTGTLLGQHALTYAVCAYLVVSMHRRLRLFPWWQQTVAMGGLFFLDRLVSFLVAGATTGQTQPWNHWLTPMISMLLWPWTFMIMREVRRRFRVS